VKRASVLILGPQRDAISGVSTHLNQLFASRLSMEYSLAHFVVGSEGRHERGAGRLLRLLASPFLLANAIGGTGAALVHVNTSMNARAFWRDLAYLLVAKFCGARVLCQVHGGALPQEFLGRGRLRHAFLRCLLKLPDVIVVLARVELEAYRRFVPGQQVFALPNSIDCAPYASLARAPSDPSMPLRLAYFGRLVRTKGLYETLQGLRLAHAQGVRATLVVAGSGPEMAQLMRFAAELGIGDDVTFAGQLNDERGAGLLTCSDVLVLASYSEGLPYALLEGMAAGTPPIATRVGAIPDVVEQGIHGLLIPPRDAMAIARSIVTLASDRNLLHRMSAAGRKRVAGGFSIERLAAEFSRLYGDLCAVGRSAESTGY
jgi:glycosyltransferase involved in cell wall biosynthesis